MHSKVQHRTMCLTPQTLEAQGSVVMRIHVLFGMTDGRLPFLAQEAWLLDFAHLPLISHTAMVPCGSIGPRVYTIAESIAECQLLSTNRGTVKGLNLWSSCCETMSTKLAIVGAMVLI